MTELQPPTNTGYSAYRFLGSNFIPYPSNFVSVKERQGEPVAVPWLIGFYETGKLPEARYVVVPNFEKMPSFSTTHIISLHSNLEEAQQQAEELSLRFGHIKHSRDERWIGGDFFCDRPLKNVQVFRHHPLGNKWTMRDEIAVLGNDGKNELLDRFRHNDFVLADNCFPLILDKYNHEICYAPPELAFLLTHNHDPQQLSFSIKPSLEQAKEIHEMNSGEQQRFVACQWCDGKQPDAGTSVKVQFTRHVPQAFAANDPTYREGPPKFVVIQRQRYQGSLCSRGEIVSAHENYQSAIAHANDRYIESQLRKPSDWGDLQMPSRADFVEEQSLESTPKQSNAIELKGGDVHVFRQIGKSQRQEYMMTRTSKRTEVQGILKEVATKVKSAAGLKAGDTYVLSNYHTYTFDGDKGMRRVHSDVGKQLVQQMQQQQISYGHNQSI